MDALTTFSCTGEVSGGDTFGSLYTRHSCTPTILPPDYFYGEEQSFYLYDSAVSNYLFGRQAMMSNEAWHSDHHLW
ncbi:hypothetical protein C8R48DRAFT_776907 [Suillus tomentosus]|nr:hypothetical protein C8R48DRAFT_776907 [Suillus tomentosus]